jgi:hypothetical protein
MVSIDFACNAASAVAYAFRPGKVWHRTNGWVDVAADWRADPELRIAAVPFAADPLIELRRVSVQADPRDLLNAQVAIYEADGSGAPVQFLTNFEIRYSNGYQVYAGNVSASLT